MQTRFQDLKQRQVDLALDQWRDARLPPRPATGWIKAIREALGVPASYLAKRLGVVNSTLTRLEKSEADDCRRAFKSDHLCALNFDQGLRPPF